MFSSHLKIIRKFGTSSVARVHGDKDGTRWIQRDFCSFKHKLINLLHDRPLNCQDLLSYNWQYLRNKVNSQQEDLEMVSESLFKLFQKLNVDHCFGLLKLRAKQPWQSLMRPGILKSNYKLTLGYRIWAFNNRMLKDIVSILSYRCWWGSRYLWTQTKKAQIN